jgi:surface antigen
VNKKTNTKQNRFTPKQIGLWLGVAIALISAVPIANIAYVAAQSVWDQIEDLEQENEKNVSALEKLQGEATSYQDAIDKLEAQIADLQRKIDANTKEQDRLKVEIAKAEAELQKQKNLLGENIRAMYVEGDMTTLEMLASSNDLSEFVDKEQYRNSVKDKISATVTKINEIKHQLRGQKELIDTLLAEQNNQRAELADSRGEQTKLLSFNKGQQDAFNAKVQKNQAKIEELIASQIQANNAAQGLQFIRIPGSVKGHNVSKDDYPYKKYGHSQLDAPCPGPPISADSLDRWGYCTRQCTSYVAWAIERSGRDAPRNWGDAKKWAALAPSSWRVYAPRTGDIAVVTSGRWGHVMYVEQVQGSRILVSEYNIALTGKYNSRWIDIR